MRHTPPPPLDIAALIPDFAPLSRVTVRLHPRRGESPIAASKMGGPIVWPRDEAWPICDQHQSPFVAVLQLRTEDIPELACPKGANLFQLLWCPNDHEEGPPLYAPAAQVFWRDRHDIRHILDVFPSPVLHDMERQYCPSPCVLHPERVVEYPAAFEPRGESSRFVEEIRVLTGSFAGHRISRRIRCAGAAGALS